MSDLRGCADAVAGPVLLVAISGWVLGLCLAIAGYAVVAGIVGGLWLASVLVFVALVAMEDG